jgi:hypothetical protein
VLDGDTRPGPDRPILVLGIKVAASTVWKILKEARIDPPPERSSSTCADFLHSQADALLACDFFETITLTGARLHELAAIEHATRRIHVLGVTVHPTASWVAQAAKNLVMDLEDASSRARFLIRDRDGKILNDAGIEVILSGVQMPRMNSIMERWSHLLQGHHGGPTSITSAALPQKTVDVLHRHHLLQHSWHTVVPTHAAALGPATRCGPVVFRRCLSTRVSSVSCRVRADGPAARWA